MAVDVSVDTGLVPPPSHVFPNVLLYSTVVVERCGQDGDDFLCALGANQGEAPAGALR
ncbi:MAG: hypothetical protein ACJAQ3_002375, partial [Planctomycetota bacterium]